MRRLAAGLVAALVVGGCGDPGSGRANGEPRAVDALAAAAEQAADAGSARMTMSLSMDVPGETMELDAEGAMDFDREVAEMTMTMSGGGVPAGTEVDVVLEGDYMYMRFPKELSGPVDAGWLRMNITEAPGPTQGQSVFSQDPAQMLQLLRGASEDIEEVGTEEVRGVTTTHFRATLSIEKMLDQAPDQESAERLRSRLDGFEGLETIPADVWIDADGLPRRMTVEMTFEAGGESGGVDMSMDMFDFGVEVDARPPKRFEDLPV
ncbi:MAG TPA: hypothetical protein VHN37_04445 [Actinomycetota bacterium]|nr:hypothetical protein [Actinomycetota bacterium]